MKDVKPVEVISQVARALPLECREYIVIIGSLAAAYAYFGVDEKMAVRTKDKNRRSWYLLWPAQNDGSGKHA